MIIQASISFNYIGSDGAIQADKINSCHNNAKNSNKNDVILVHIMENWNNILLFVCCTCVREIPNTNISWEMSRLRTPLQRRTWGGGG